MANCFLYNIWQVSLIPWSCTFTSNSLLYELQALKDLLELRFSRKTLCSIFLLRMLSSGLVLPGFGSWFWLISIIAAVRLLYSRYHHSLYKHNGPFLASFTNLWKLCHAYRNRFGEPMIKVHEKYGSVVRTGPNTLSFGHPQAIRDIYGPGKNFVKVSAMFHSKFQACRKLTLCFLLLVRILFCPKSCQQGRSCPDPFREF